MSGFKSTEQRADVDWTDTQTGEKHTTEVYVFPGNGGSFGTHTADVIALAELGGRRDIDRVQIDAINPKP